MSTHAPDLKGRFAPTLKTGLLVVSVPISAQALPGLAQI